MIEQVVTANMQKLVNEYMRDSLDMMQGIWSMHPRRLVDVDEKIYVELGAIDYDDGDDNTQPLEEFMAKLREIASGAPAGVEVVVEPKGNGYDDDRSASIEIGYWRSPTDGERADREKLNRDVEAHNAKVAEREAAAEREKYEALKAKFERDSD